MRKRYDRIDFFVAVGLFAVVAVWAFLWAHPCPHPDLWPFLVAAQGRVDAVTLGIAGRIALGAFAAFAYLVLRGFQFLRRNRGDRRPDDVLSTRAVPICGAAAFALLPCSWRAGQFLSPGFALLLLTVVGLFLWFCGRGGRGRLSYSLAYLLFGFVCGMTPLGIVPLGCVVALDVVLRWKDGQKHGQREADAFAQKKKDIETWFSSFAGLVGFVLGVAFLVVLLKENETAFDFGVLGTVWWTAWTDAAMRSAISISPSALALVLVIATVVVGTAIGRRVRSIGRHGLTVRCMLSGLLMVGVLALFLRSVDRAERIRLQAIREYASLVADDVQGVRFLFSDGRLDDLLRLEFASRGSQTAVLNTMAAPSPEESARLKALAPESGDRVVFEAGGAEVFKAWARERPDRLASSAWQLGGGIVRRYGKVRQRTSGAVIRSADAARTSADDAADARFAEWSQRIGTLAETRPSGGSLLGGTDDAVARCFDALLWRAARLAGERAAQQADKKAAVAEERERQMMRRLDGLNASLRAQGELVERMLPTEKLVVTPREALDVALKRADFALARRYAREILVGTPDDSAANFALGMANLEEKEYFRASICFEKALEKNPNEPAALNNLAIAYMKSGQSEKALKSAERAAQVHPKSPQILQTLSEIRKVLRRRHGSF